MNARNFLKQKGLLSLKDVDFDNSLVKALNEFSDIQEDAISEIERFDSNVFMPPFRLGKKQKRAILDSNGKEVIIMPKNSEKQAQMYCDYLNFKNEII